MAITGPMQQVGLLYLSVIVATFYGFTLFNESLGASDWLGDC